MFSNREQYARDLAEKQRKHLEDVANRPQNWQPCAHDSCNECHGTGVKKDGSGCIHMISCSCPKCSPR
jgi:hypothetical protein